MKPYFACLFLSLTPAFLFAQSNRSVSGSEAGQNLARLSARRVSALPVTSYKSPVMQRLWTAKHNHQPTKIRPLEVPTSQFLTTPPMYGAGSNPFDIALGDFNADNKKDVIVAGNPPVLLLGNGDGSLQSPVAIGSISSSPTVVGVGDFNRDGKLDVVFAISGGAVLYLGNGDGTFAAGITISSDGTNDNVFARVLVADVNNDGVADLILNTDSGLSVLLGNGNATFQAPITSPGSVQFMSAADFNGDGHVDLAVTNGFNSIGIMLGNGAGNFAISSTYKTTNGSLNTIAIADYNRDGFQDVALPNGQLFLGKGDGTLKTPISFPNGGGASAVAAVDINGDGIPDLLTATAGDCGTADFGDVAVALGNGNATFQPSLSFPTGGCFFQQRFIAVGDLDNDGAPDVIVWSGTNAGLSVLVNKGNGTFVAAEMNPSGGSGGVAVDDFNRDGNVDVVLADGSVYLGNGDGTLRFSGSAGLGGVAVATGDFNHDGIPDVAAAVECAPTGCGSGGQVLIAAGNGDGTFRVPTALPSGGFYAEALVVADFNGDGNLDIAVVNNCADSGCSGGGSVSIYLGNGQGTFTLLNTIGNLTGFSTSVVAGDFNNDGITDLAVGGVTEFYNYDPFNVLIGNGDGSFQPPKVSYTTNIWGITGAATADLNGDGILDLAFADGGCSDCGSSGSNKCDL